MARAHFFIRDDDVWTLDNSFRFFFDMAYGRGLPVVYAVIPGKMDKDLIRFLCRAKEKTPHLLDIVQHGWVHTNHSSSQKLKYEFGASRPLKSQCEDIEQGLKQMQSAFGELFTPAFVPPYHGYDQHTLQALSEANFKIFSAGSRRSSVKKRFIEIPAQISFSRYEQGKTSIYKARDVIAELVRGIHHRSLSGVLTHHKDFKNAMFRKELVRFFDWTLALRSKEEWRVLLFSDILSRPKER